MIQERVVKPYEQDRYSQYVELGVTLRRKEVYDFLRDRLVPIIGPLTVKERWELMPKLGLGPIQAQVNLEGSAYNVASEIINRALHFSYPLNITIILYLCDENDLGSLESLLRPILEKFTDPK